jgi:hypothetical protein
VNARESEVVVMRMRGLWPKATYRRLSEAILAIAPYEQRTALHVLTKLEEMQVRVMPSAELIAGCCDDVERGTAKRA